MMKHEIEPENEIDASWFEWRVVVRDSSSSFAANQLTFDTPEDARHYGWALSCRWLAMREYAVLHVDIEPDEGPFWTRERVQEHAIGGIITC